MNIDLGCHGVVEASAGTGKTHTIEQLTLRLLIEQDITLENVLVVTFTEKATGELRERIRKLLEREFSERPRLQASLDRFDQAPIFTIHGFCQRVLQEYALEQGQDFRAEVVDDLELLRTALRDVQRRKWRQVFGEHLRAVLEHANFHRDTAEIWQNRVVEAALRFKPRCGHQLHPAPIDGWWRRLQEADANFHGQLEVHTVRWLREAIQEFKRERGLMSFDDMIGLVEQNLDPALNPESAAFIDTLRSRYRFGIVDEFQDTDPLQWRIFRRIFLEGGASRLFVVGDPKQAIFGFRGADLPTYLRAVDEMKAEFSAIEYPLTVNWRSDPDLLDGLNVLFGSGEWFPEETGIRFRDVEPPPEEERRFRIDSDQTSRPALTFVDLLNFNTLLDARTNFARFTTHEIKKLLFGREGGPAMSIAVKGEPRALQADDICVLVFRRTEADELVEFLSREKIPFSFQRQDGGLWQSDEVEQLELLLRCLMKSEDRASFRKVLLTCFFRVRPEDVVRIDEAPSRHPARDLFQRWVGFAEQRQWSALFQSLLEDTGLLFEDPTEERLTNLRYLFSALEQAGHGGNRDLLGILDFIAEKRKTRVDDLQPGETRIPRVRILTVHASKGLEFPIVFVLGGHTQRVQLEAAPAYRDDQGRLVFSLAELDEEIRQRIRDERQNEFRRLLYVALTRAVFKLYVPLVQATGRGKGSAGPLVTILQPAWELSHPEDRCPSAVDVVKMGLFTMSDAEQEELKPRRRPPLQFAGMLFPPLDANLPKRRISMKSFSSLHRQQLAQLGDTATYGDVLSVSPDEQLDPGERDDPLRGPVFGEMVHEALETVDFAEVGRAERASGLLRRGTSVRQALEAAILPRLPLLRSQQPREDLERACFDLVADLVWKSLHTPLARLGGPLWRVPPHDRLHELEFLFPEFPQQLPADVRWEEGFFTGYIDLVFRVSGKLYLLDWKTNLLPAYDAAHLARSMEDSGYHRQYRLYLHALARWLNRNYDNSPESHLGGVYYLYVRGLNATDESTGVFFHQPAVSDLELKAALA